MLADILFRAGLLLFGALVLDIAIRVLVHSFDDATRQD